MVENVHDSAVDLGLGGGGDGLHHLLRNRLFHLVFFPPRQFILHLYYTTRRFILQSLLYLF